MEHLFQQQDVMESMYGCSNSCHGKCTDTCKDSCDTACRYGGMLI